MMMPTLRMCVPLQSLFIWLKLACGGFSGHYFVAAGKKRAFCQQCPAHRSIGSSLIRDVAEDLVEASRLQVQLLQLEPLGGGQLGDRGKNSRASARQCGYATVTLAHLDFRYRGQGGEGAS